MGSQRTALYLRLSREDEEKNAESQSIANQREFLLAYAREKGFGVVDIFTDDGWSGTTFQRPGFRQLLTAIECGRVDTVITRDLSRLGRDYIQTGHFLECYFPEKGVRYIAVNDGIDTGKREGAGDMAPFLSVFNDLYAKDISKKVRAALDTKKRGGKFIGSMPPYGYQKDPADRNRLIPDPATAPVVQKIYKTYLGNASLLGVARMLTVQGIPTPGKSVAWNDVMIRRILVNPTYIGNLTQNRTKKINYKVHKKISLPPSEWIVVQGTHEPLISPVEFESVQQLLRVRGYAKRQKKEPRLLSGLVACGDCGASMTFLCQRSRVYLVCSASRRPGEKRCTSHCIREDAVEQAIRETLRRIARAYPNTAMLAVHALQPEQSACIRLEKELEAEKAAFAGLYRDKAKGLLTEAEYLELRDTLRSERQRLEERLKIEQQREQDQEDPLASVNSFLRFNSLDRATLMALVEKIVVYKDKSLDIHFRFRAPDAGSI